MPLIIAVSHRKERLQLLWPRLVFQHLRIEPIKLDQRDMVEQDADAVLSGIGCPVEGGWHEASHSLSGFTASIFQQPEPASNGWFISWQWLNMQECGRGSCWQGWYSDLSTDQWGTATSQRG